MLVWVFKLGQYRTEPAGSITLALRSSLRLHQRRIHALDLPLQLLLGCFVETGEFDPHAHSPVAGPDHACGLHSFGIQPESNGHFLCDRERRPGLDVAASGAHVRRGRGANRAHTLPMPDFQGKGNSVATKFSLVLHHRCGPENGRGCHGPVRRPLPLPRTRLSRHDLLPPHRWVVPGP